MNLVTPEFGLLFWMVVIFGIVFFLLAKFGFPVITDMVDERSAKIAQSLKDADEIQARMEQWKSEHAKMLEDVRKEQSAILREATETRARLRDVRKEVALLGVQVAEKVLRHELQDDGNQKALLDQLVKEASEASLRS